MNRKRFMASAVALTLGASILFGCGGSSGSSTGSSSGSGGEAKQPVKVGAVFILTGANSGYGIAQRAGVEIAVDEINKAGGINGAQLQVIFEDSQGNKDQAINAVRKLIDKDSVTTIIGPTLSTEMFAAGPVANEAGVPILGISTTAAGITDIGKYVFRNSLPEAGVLPHTIKRAIDKHKIKKVATTWAANDDFSKSGYETFKAELKKANVEIAVEASHNLKDQQFDAQITRLLAGKPDAIVISSLYQEAALFMVQARKAGYTGPFIGGNGFNSPALIDVAKEAAEGAIVGSPWYGGRDNAKVKAFVAAYTAKMNGKGPDQFAAQAYDGTYLVAEALKKAGSTNRDKVRDALAGVKGYDGVTGKFAFDANRNPDMAPFVLEVKGGKYIELK